MPLTESPFTERAAALARQLALAAHWGLEDVPHRAAPPAPQAAHDEPSLLALPAAQDLRFNLEPFGDLLGHTCTTPAGVPGLPLRFLRGFFKFVLGPWLDLQTQFNQAVLQTLLHDQASTRAYLQQLAEHVRHQQATGQAMHERIDALQQAQRLSVRHVMQTLERSFGRAALTETNGNAATARIIEQVFLQAWLPRPPAAVLVLGGEDGDGLHLAALGYQVIADNGFTGEKPSPLAHDEAAFDAVVCLARSGVCPQTFDQCRRALRPGGRAIVGVMLDDAVRQAPSPPSPPSGFRLMKAAYAVSGERGWTYTTDAAVVESLRTRAPLACISLLAAEKD